MNTSVLFGINCCCHVGSKSLLLTVVTVGHAGFMLPCISCKGYKYNQNETDQDFLLTSFLNFLNSLIQAVAPDQHHKQM